MKSKTKDYLVSTVYFVIIAIVSLSLGIKIANIMTERADEIMIEHTDETTTAQPIYQQKMGDDINPDILIIYEAEVDGVKVYPSVVKEAEK